MGFLYFIIFGGFIGWLAGKLTKGSGFGIIANILIGIGGSMIGKFGFSLLGIGTYSTIGEIVCSLLGAITLLYIIGKTKK